MTSFKKEVQFIRELYSETEIIPLHAPFFADNATQHVSNCIRSSYVSTAKGYVDDVEHALCKMYSPNFVLPTVSGVTALKIGLLISGVLPKDLVITQALSFVATANAIKHVGAEPVFLDVDPTTLGLNPLALQDWLAANAIKKNNKTIYKHDGRRIAAVLPMHTFGHPLDIDGICKVAEHWSIPVVEDAAESFGSTYKKD